MFFQRSDEEILLENLNRVECENALLRDQIEDMERELDFRDRRITEMEAELKVLRGEREQFVEMQVRLEIQHKELGLIMREQKGQQRKRSPLVGGRRGSGSNTVNTEASQGSSQIMSLKRFFQKFKSKGSKQSLEHRAKAGGGSPLEVTLANPSLNMTTVAGQSPRNMTMTARSGTFNNGNLTLRQNTDSEIKDSLAREFALLRADQGDTPADMLDNTNDLISFKYRS